MTEHAAAGRNAIPIFQRYFERLPPFDGKDYKEFPDAFVIDALEAWCELNDTRMYVVTGDKAMLRAAEARDRLIAVPELADLLAIATADHDPDVEAAVARVLALPGFTTSLEESIDEKIGDVGVSYQADLADGEVESVSRAGSPRNLDWCVISAGGGRYGLLIGFDLDLKAAVDFEDRELAFYDKEDDRYYGAENASSEVDSEAAFKMFVEVDEEARVVRGEMLTGGVTIDDWGDDYR